MYDLAILFIYIDFQHFLYIIFFMYISFHAYESTSNDPVGRAGRICHLENVKSHMSYLQQYTKIIKMLTLKTCFS